MSSPSLKGLRKVSMRRWRVTGTPYVIERERRNHWHVMPANNLRRCGFFTMEFKRLRDARAYAETGK